MGCSFDISSNGRSRQGRRHQTRNVGRKSAGLPGIFIQVAVDRGPRSRLSLALHEISAESRAHWNLQSQLLRRGACRSGAPRISGQAKTAAEIGWKRNLVGAFRRHSQFRTISGAERRRRAEILSPCLKERTETAIPSANRRQPEELEVLV